MNVAITCLFTSIENPMCPGCDNYPSDPEILRRWVSSITDAHAVIVHDGWIGRDEQAKLRQWSPSGYVTTHAVMPTDENLYFQRWIHLWDWLVAHHDVDWVFMTDGSDVVMNRPPWDEMEPDTLYVGSENDVVSNRWIVANHPSITLMAESHPDRRLMNPGLVGGDRATVLGFLTDFTALPPLDDMTDMAAFNYCVREEQWRDRVVSGHQVHTRFNAWEKPNGTSWWSHK